MTHIADNPVLVPDREEKPASEPPRIRWPALRLVTPQGRQMVFAHAAMLGTRSTREECAQRACVSGVTHNASAADGRPIQIGMRSIDIGAYLIRAVSVVEMASFFPGAL